LDWPDQLNLSLGQFSYYGDNKKPGHELHDTQRGGNRLLRATFASLHSEPPARKSIPPFFVFTKRPTPSSARSVQFRGLAAPGLPGYSATEDLIALWKTSAGLRFQNYRATFTILDIAVIPRGWLNQLSNGSADGGIVPKAWAQWRNTGAYAPLTAEPPRSSDPSRSRSPIHRGRSQS
jgi:hypothetical protein